MLHFRTIDADRLKNRFTGQCLTRGESFNFVVKPCGETNQRWDRWIQNKPFFFIHGLHNEGVWNSNNRCLTVKQKKQAVVDILVNKSKEYRLLENTCDYTNSIQEWHSDNENIYNLNSKLYLNVDKDGNVFLSKDSGLTTTWYFIKD